MAAGDGPMAVVSFMRELVRMRALRTGGLARPPVRRSAAVTAGAPPKVSTTVRVTLRCPQMGSMEAARETTRAARTHRRRRHPCRLPLHFYLRHLHYPLHPLLRRFRHRHHRTLSARTPSTTLRARQRARSTATCQLGRRARAPLASSTTAAGRRRRLSSGRAGITAMTATAGAMTKRRARAARSSAPPGRRRGGDGTSTAWAGGVAISPSRNAV
jgi:hypothetical protein